MKRASGDGTSLGAELRSSVTEAFNQGLVGVRADPQATNKMIRLGIGMAEKGSGGFF